MTDILVGEDGVEEKCWLAPFVEISKSPKLSILRQSLLLFLRHFLAVDGAGTEDETRLKLIRERIDRVADYLKKKWSYVSDPIVISLDFGERCTQIIYFPVVNEWKHN